MKNTINQDKWWVYSTAFIMPFNGGYINAICLLSILRNPVGYVTGNLTFAGDSIARGNFLLFFHLVALVFCFLLGSIVSGLIVKSQNFKIDRRYSASLILQFCTVVSAMILLLFGYDQAGYLLALAMGMQNAMITHYGTALIRTTHMTGTTTDLGILISRWIKGHPVEFWKMRLYLCLITGFGCGAMAGALIYHFLHAAALSISLIFYLAMLKWRSFQPHASDKRNGLKNC